MLTGWADSQLFKLLNSIFYNPGIEVMTVNPTYDSIIGLVKYLIMYGLASDEAAGLVIARRGMRLAEKLAASLSALVEFTSTQHVGNLWNQVNNKIKHSGMITNTHTYY
ncbi:hypothetical protein NDI47_11345 [Microcoleus vaginatus GB1-A2]|uniref:hypothetical protein n=1 Tax=Microcoleus vaginatus TaxID=119532 RepID=UPI001684BEA5|nr:hypothetical protein [Microcoleus sp. FACHB-61]